MNSCLREICYFAALYEFEVCAVHVPGVSNHFVDLLSDGTRARYQQRDNSYSVFSAIIGKTFPFLIRFSGFTILSNIGPLFFQDSESSGACDGISSTRSAPHIVMILSVT